MAATLLAGLFLGSRLPASASIIVTSTGDTTADDGVCTLREAALAVNTQAPSGATPGECAAPGGGVSFALPAGSIIPLLHGPIVFERSVTIKGPGRDALTITLGAGGSRLLVFDGRGESDAFDLWGLTLAYGEGTIAYDGALYYGEGGALLVIEASTLTIVESRFLGNTAFYAGAAIAIHDIGFAPLLQDLEFEDNLVAGAPGGGGAAIYYDSGETLQIRRSLFLENRVTNVDADPEAESNGGAIWIPGSSAAALNLEESTFSGNQATGAGGAIAFGTAALSADVTATIWDCTFTLNEADTNANSPDQAGGALHLLWNLSSTTLTNSIVAGNSDSSLAATPAADLRAGPATLTSGGFNRIGVRAGATVTFPAGLPNLNDDWVGTFASPLAAGLHPLADHGGFARGHLPQSGLAQPILDQGSCSGSFYDQRDWRGEAGPRLFDQAAVADAADGCDIGALEVGLLAPEAIFDRNFETGDFQGWSGAVGFAP